MKWFWEKLAHLRTKPEHVRRRYAFVITSCISVLIVVIWATTFSIDTGDQANVAEVLSPGQGFFKSFKEVYATTKESLTTAISGIEYERATDTPMMLEELVGTSSMEITEEQLTATSANYEQGQ